MTEPTLITQRINATFTDRLSGLDPDYISPAAWVSAAADALLLVVFTQNVTLADANQHVQEALAAHGCVVPIQFGYSAGDMTSTHDHERFHGPYVQVRGAHDEEHVLAIGLTPQAVEWVDGVA